MSIAKKVKTGLDETRMLILGVQILIGFQFRSVFQNSFDQLPVWSRHFDGVALLLLILTVALLSCPALITASSSRGLRPGGFIV